MSLLAIYISSLEKYPLKFFVHFLLLVVTFRNSLYILDIRHDLQIFSLILWVDFVLS